MKDKSLIYLCDYCYTFHKKASLRCRNCINLFIIRLDIFLKYNGKTSISEYMIEAVTALNSAGNLADKKEALRRVYRLTRLINLKYLK